VDTVETNAAGIHLIKKWEGLVDGDPSTPGLEPYLDPVSIPTLGYGSIWGSNGSRVTMDHPAITEAEAERLLARELGATERYVTHLVRVPITLNAFSALCSFTYNVGSGNFSASTLRSRLNRQDYIGASQEFWKWRRARGIILAGLVARRAEECQLFLL
jgi:lysozyme